MIAPSKPRLSNGESVYNGERYPGPAIESLLVRTFSDVRLIIADNASTDGTEEICRAAGRRIDYPDSASRAA
jgi:glycosyltransferase involved in cell wall biosynthesis